MAIWHHMQCYTRSKGKPTTNKHQEKLLNSTVSNHVVHTHLQMTQTKGSQLLLKRGRGGRYLNVRDIMRSKRNIALKISITLQAYDSSGSLQSDQIAKIQFPKEESSVNSFLSHCHCLYMTCIFLCITSVTEYIDWTGVNII